MKLLRGKKKGQKKKQNGGKECYITDTKIES